MQLQKMKVKIMPIVLFNKHYALKCYTLRNRNMVNMNAFRSYQVKYFYFIKLKNKQNMAVSLFIKLSIYGRR
jgi:hypothetical protein